MRVYQNPIDYQHIQVYGKIQGWTKDFITGQQWLAMHTDAPFDTVEVTTDGVPIRFQDLPPVEKRKFNTTF